MRFAILMVVPCALCAQAPEADTRLTQALISELQQLRMAIERSTLINTRSQLAINQLQLQSGTAARLSQQYNEAKANAASMNVQKAQLAEAVKQMEEKRTSPENVNPLQRESVEDRIRQMKIEMEAVATHMQLQSAKEGELAMQLQAAESQVTDTRNRIAELEKAIDAAIQQLFKPK